MRKKLICLLLLGAAVFAGAVRFGDQTKVVQTGSFASSPYTLIIDAGHGGEDGGAVSVSGTAESEINLSICLKMEDILALYGVSPKMLRREDRSLHDESADTLRKKKVSDLHNRVAMIEETENPLLISIHQNSFPDSRYHGAQVFYAPTDGSKELAMTAQENLSIHLDPQNLREAKLIPDTVYLMNHITCPAILVECGFLTNIQEEELLRRDSYQRKLAACLAGTVLSVL